MRVAPTRPHDVAHAVACQVSIDSGSRIGAQHVCRRACSHAVYCKSARAKRGQRAVAIGRARRQDRRCGGRESKRSGSEDRAARASPSRAHPPTAAAVVRSLFESCGGAVDEPKRRRDVLGEAHGRALDEVSVDTLRRRRLRSDAVACPRRARHCVGSSAGRRATAQHIYSVVIDLYVYLYSALQHRPVGCGR